MTVLAIETATQTCSVALVQGETTLASRVLPPETKAAKYLAPAIREALAEAGKSVDDVTALAVDVGPGSFTGLRVGIGLAKGLAFARDLPVYGILSLDVLAEQARRDLPEGALGDGFAATLDAYRGQVFLKPFAAHDIEDSGEATVLDLDKWLASPQGLTLLFGQVPKARLAEVRERGLFLTAGEQVVPDAAAVGRLASRRIAAGHPPDDVFALLPVYLRKSAAEEKADSREAS
ncbi:MAG TPA: tRNA (adenosine(37)-N6)-threonylcarbamoyltransferase complex dimerization subunit type 1 TsaB [Pirellulaceae bacterium]|jgi:tRNA threonylcarbamoyladenosine biosynthesis protein TsaB|nr:tRNA (adenosine(37)-N6)-threonylcarbamoyltransferase complex dimerization subunit type 1 TsaB [Pirellulaceae bacterium]